MKQVFVKRVKIVDFNIGDLVLKRDARYEVKGKHLTIYGKVHTKYLHFWEKNISS